MCRASVKPSCPLYKRERPDPLCPSGAWNSTPALLAAPGLPDRVATAARLQRAVIVVIDAYRTPGQSPNLKFSYRTSVAWFCYQHRRTSEHPCPNRMNSFWKHYELSISRYVFSLCFHTRVFVVCVIEIFWYYLLTLLRFLNLYVVISLSFKWMKRYLMF